MTTPDYEIHIGRERFDSLWSTEESEGFPFPEDMDDIDRAIAEELGEPKRRKKRRKAPE